MTMRYRSFSLVACVLMLVLFSACQPEPTIEPPTRVPSLTPAPPTSTPTPTAEPTQISRAALPRTIAENPLNQAFLRVIHASPELPSINVDVQGLRVATLTFPLITSSTGIEAGDYTLTISTPDESILIERQLTILGGNSKIIMVTGTETAPNISIFDENLQSLNENETRVKFIHGIASGPTITAQANNTTISTPLEFGEISSATVLPSTTTELIFQGNGEPFTTTEVNLRSRRSSTFILLGTLDSPQVLEFGEQVPGISPLRLIHASPDLPAIDVYFDNQLIAGDLSFTRSTERLPLAAKSYTVTLSLTGEDEPFHTSTFSLLADQPISLVLAGTVDSPETIRVVDDLSSIRPEQARISFLNPIAAYSNVNVAFSGGTVPGIPDFLGYRQVSPSTQLEAGLYDFMWTDVSTEGNPILEQAQSLELQAGRSYFYILTALPDSQPLIFSENIDIVQTLANVPVDQPPTPAPSSPTRLRFVNANDDALTVNIVVNTLEITSALGYGAGTNYIVAPAGLYTITANNSETGALLATLDFEFDLQTDYSIFVYGYELDQYRIAVVEDDNVTFNQSDLAGVRLVNLSNDNNLVFQLGYSPSPEVRAPQAETTESADPVRPRVPFGVSRLSGEVPSGTASSHATVEAGNADLLVIEPRSNAIAGTFPQLPLETRTIYDLVIYQDLFSQRIKGFLIAHATP